MRTAHLRSRHGYLICVVMAGLAWTGVLAPPSAVLQAQTTRPAESDASRADDPLEDDPPETWGNNTLKRTPHDVHGLIIDQTVEVFRQGEGDGLIVTTDPAGIRFGPAVSPVRTGGFVRAVHTSREIQVAFPFNEVVPSTNVEVPPDAGYVLHLRMRRADDQRWTGWYYLGTWGPSLEIGEKRIRDEHGVIQTDYFESPLAFDRLQYRLTLYAADPQTGPIVRRVALALSNTLNDAALHARFARTPPTIPSEKWARRLPVPFRSQTVENRDIAGSVCSPTSVGMVMAYRGVDVPTARLAEIIWDDEYKIFGNWSRAVQGAYTFGVPGYLRRFGHWDEVKEQIAAGQPVIASIRVEKLNGLRGAPYRRTRGHLLVITGFDADGNILVNDPAAKTAEQGMTTYLREDMEAAWLDRGGLGYILEPVRQHLERGGGPTGTAPE